jgi:hypothetical protein
MLAVKCTLAVISSGVEKVCWLVVLLRLTRFLDSARNETTQVIIILMGSYKYILVQSPREGIELIIE